MPSTNSELPQDPQIIDTTATVKPDAGVIEDFQAGTPISGETIENDSAAIESPDLDDPNLRVVRPPRPEANSRKMGPRGWLAAVVGGAVLAGGVAAGANALSSNNDSEPINNGDKKEQVDKVTTITEMPISPTTDVEVDGVDPNSPVTSINDNLPTPTTTEQSVDDPVVDVTPSQGDSPNMMERTPGPGEVSTPISNEQVDSSETYEGQTSVRDAVMLVDYMIGNQALTGVSPTIEIGPNGTGTLTFSSPKYSISAYANFDAKNGTLLLDQPTSYTRGIKSIEVTYNGQIVRIKSDDFNEIPSLYVFSEGKNVTTNPIEFEGSDNDPKLASRLARDIIDGVNREARDTK